MKALFTILLQMKIVKIENIAWSYGDAILAFAFFGDVVTFGTTYRTITHSMLLWVWFGIDNHGKAIFLGFVLLQDESAESFSWALQVCGQKSLRPFSIYIHFSSQFS